MKKPPAGERAKPPRRVDYFRQLFKDWNRLSRSGRYDMHRLKAVMLLLIANDAPLGPEWRDHELKGSWAHYRECHARIVDELLCRAPNRLHGVAARGVPRAKLAELLPSGPGFSGIALGVPA